MRRGHWSLGLGGLAPYASSVPGSAYWAHRMEGSWGAGGSWRSQLTWSGSLIERRCARIAGGGRDVDVSCRLRYWPGGSGLQTRGQSPRHRFSQRAKLTSIADAICSQRSSGSGHRQGQGCPNRLHTPFAMSVPGLAVDKHVPVAQLTRRLRLIFGENSYLGRRSHSLGRVGVVLR